MALTKEFICWQLIIFHFTDSVDQGEPGSPGMTGLPGPAGHGLPGQKVMTPNKSVTHTHSP